MISFKKMFMMVDFMMSVYKFTFCVIILNFYQFYEHIVH